MLNTNQLSLLGRAEQLVLWHVLALDAALPRTSYPVAKPGTADLVDLTELRPFEAQQATAQLEAKGWLDAYTLALTIRPDRAVSVYAPTDEARQRAPVYLRELQRLLANEQAQVRHEPDAEQQP